MVIEGERSDIGCLRKTHIPHIIEFEEENMKYSSFASAALCVVAITRVAFAASDVPVQVEIDLTAATVATTSQR